MANALEVQEAYRAQSRALLIRECQSSELTNKEFCRQRGISEKSYYYWLKKLRGQAAETACGNPQLVRLASNPAEGDRLKISFRGAELSLPAEVDLEAVAAVLCSIQRL